MIDCVHPHHFYFFFLATLFAITACKEKSSQPASSQPKIEEGIEFAQPSSVGIDTTELNKMTSAIKSGEYPNIHSVLIAKNGKLIYEKYFPGKDEILGNSIGFVNHHKDSLHDVRSVTKSVVSACIGIALSQGLIKSIDQPVWEYFPEYAAQNKGNKSSLTIKHLLTMTSGLDWNENLPYTDPANSEIQMDKSADPILFVLSRKLVSEPGTQWNYNGGTTQVLAAIIKKASGVEVDEFAMKNLFSPLGISNFHWIKFEDSLRGSNVPLAAAGLRMRSRDMLKFGILYMNRGSWNHKEILTEAWVADSHKSQITRGDLRSGKGGYGYQFWTFQKGYSTDTTEIATAVGNGDQRIFFDPKNELLVVITAGNYNQWTIKNNAAALLSNFIYPAVFEPAN